MEREREREEETIERLTTYFHDELQIAPDEARGRAHDLLLLLGGAHAVELGAVRHWWTFLVRGCLAIVFGVLFLVSPGPALSAFVLAFGIWIAADGILLLSMSITSRHSWRLALAGIAGVGAGALTLFRPGITAVALYAIAAVWAIVRGVLEIASGVRLRHVVDGELWMILSGVVSILFGVLLFVLPSLGLLALAWLIGIYAVMFGAFELSLAFRLRRVDQALPPLGHKLPPASTTRPLPT